MSPLLAAVWRPLATILLAGLVRFLTDFQSTGHLVPSLVDGALTAADAAAAVVGLPIAIIGVSGLVAQARAGLPTTAPPAGPPPAGGTPAP